MAEQYKLIHSAHFFRDYLHNNLRPDGRDHDMFRPVGINAGSISESIASSIIKLGNTTIICGIRAELAKPRAVTPKKGYFIPHVELAYLPFSYRNNASTNDLSDTICSSILDVFINSDCIDLDDLCIYNEKLVWALHCDIICLDNDGCILDASVIACLAALKDLCLPSILYDAAINKVEILTETKKLYIKCMPIVSTHVILQNSLLADPTFEEECISSAIINIGISNGKLNFLLKSGGTAISKKQLNFCIALSIKREVEVLKLFAEIMNG